MPFTELMTHINKIEKEFDVNSLICEGVILWPLIRSSLVFNKSTTNAPVIQSQTNLTNRYNERLEEFNHYVQKMDIDSEFIFQIDKDIKMDTIINNNNHHKLIDSLYHIMKDKYNIKILSYDDRDINTNVIYEVARLESLLNKNSYSVSKLDEFCDYMKNNDYFTVGYDYLHFISARFMIYLKYMLLFFKNIKTKILVFDCYYATDFNLALTCACDILNIKTVDLQHGLQSDTHYSYTLFNAIPTQGYQMLPDYFWVWHKINKDNIDRWALKTSKHSTIISGHLFYTYYKDFVVNKLSKTVLNKIKEIYPKNKINILVTLGRDDDYSHDITKAVNNSQNDIMWHFREHPGHQFDVYNKFIKNNILDKSKIEYEFSTTSNLYNLFPYIDIHITDFSTISFELLSFEKIPTIFTKWIESFNSIKGFYYITDENDMLDKIHHITKNLNEIQNTLCQDYINFGMDFIDDAINKTRK